jgi:cell wall-associated NlpC family hydrolase
MPGLRPATPDWPWPYLDMDIDLLLELSRKTNQPGDQYKLGGKAPSLAATAAEINQAGIDCSGYFRWLVARTTNMYVPDGSMNQRDWMDQAGFKVSSVESGLLKDGVVRAAYMRPLPKGVGHIAMIHDGQTIESSGKRGPGRRPWTGEGWQSRCVLWCLTKP